MHVDSALWIVLVNVLLESWETQHVSIFEVAIVLCVFLNRIICQMHEGIIDVLKVDSKLT